MTIGILRETKVPLDRRVTLIPGQVRDLCKQYPEHTFVVQSSSIRSFTDEEYLNEGLHIVRDIDNCDILLGIKEVEIQSLLEDKIYLMFSHTAKMQAYNRQLLKKCSEQGITLIDYEYLVKNNERVITFGYWAGIVGAYNVLIAYGMQTGNFNLKPAYKCTDIIELKSELAEVTFTKPVKFVVTGEGRVATGAIEIFKLCGIKKVTPHEFINEYFSESVFCQIGPQHYTKHKRGKKFFFKDFVENPEDYISDFFRFAKAADIFIACHYWDNRSPVILTPDQMKHPDFNIKMIADISCDIKYPIPSTVRASSIEHPFYGYDRYNEIETEPFTGDHLTVMSVDNLPGELPRDASADFGEKLKNIVIPELLSCAESEMINGATILKKGNLTGKYSYLSDYLNKS
ncbi:MAG: hypothetical protein JW894_02270 [Bacteroidales bacterium]|nr:hypothetical protein [Bacteroidales bacterium]